MINIKEFNFHNNNWVIPYRSIIYPAHISDSVLGPHEIIAIFLEKDVNNPSFVKPDGLLYCLHYTKSGLVTVTCAPCGYDKETKMIFQDLNIIYSTTCKNDVEAIHWFEKYKRSKRTRNNYYTFDVMY